MSVPSFPPDFVVKWLMDDGCEKRTPEFKKAVAEIKVAYDAHDTKKAQALLEKYGNRHLEFDKIPPPKHPMPNMAFKPNKYVEGLCHYRDHLNERVILRNHIPKLLVWAVAVPVAVYCISRKQQGIEDRQRGITDPKCSRDFNVPFLNSAFEHLSGGH